MRGVDTAGHVTYSACPEKGHRACLPNYLLASDSALLEAGKRVDAGLPMARAVLPSLRPIPSGKEVDACHVQLEGLFVSLTGVKGVHVCLDTQQHTTQCERSHAAVSKLKIHGGCGAAVLHALLTLSLHAEVGWACLLIVVLAVGPDEGRDAMQLGGASVLPGADVRQRRLQVQDRKIHRSNGLCKWQAHQGQGYLVCLGET